jgi:WD40 repeat protein
MNLTQAAVWDIETLEQIQTCQIPGIGNAAVSPDGMWIAVPTGDQIQVWSLSEGCRHTRLRGRDPFSFQSLAFSPDGKQLSASLGSNALVVGSASPSYVYSWNTSSWNNPRMISVGSPSFGTRGPSLGIAGTFGLGGGFGGTIQYDPTGYQCLAVGARGIMRRYDLVSGSETITAKSPEHISTFAFSRNGRRIATASGDGTIRLWDSSPAENPFVIVSKFQGLGPTSLAFLADSKRLYAGTGVVRQSWDTASGRSSFVQAQNIFGSNWAISPDGTLLAETKGDRMVLRRADSSTPLAELPCDDGSFALRFSTDGSFLICVDGSYNSLRLWDIKSRTQLRRLAVDKDIFCVGLDGGANRVALGHIDGSLTIIDARTGHVIRSMLAHTKAVPAYVRREQFGILQPVSDDETIGVNSLVFSPDGKHLVSAGGDGFVKLWNLQSDDPYLVIAGHGGSVLALAYSPDGQRLATACTDGKLRLFEAETGEEVLALAFSADSDPIVSHPATIAFSPDGNKLAAADLSGRIHLWETNAVSAMDRRTRSLVYLVSSYWSECEINEELCVKLRGDNSLTANELKEALDIAEQYPEYGDSSSLSSLSWSVACTPDATPEDWRLALRQAQAAFELLRDDTDTDWADCYQTLAAAQYRTGRYREALQSLFMMSVSQLQNLQPELSESDYLFAAMTHHRLGNREVARSLLHQAHKSIEQTHWRVDSNAEALFEEAEELIEGKKPSQLRNQQGKGEKP